MKFLLLPALAGALVLGACSSEENPTADDNNVENNDPKAAQASFKVDGMT